MTFSPMRLADSVGLRIQGVNPSNCEADNQSSLWEHHFFLPHQISQFSRPLWSQRPPNSDTCGLRKTPVPTTTCIRERSSLWYGAPYGPDEPQLIGTEVRTVTDDDIGLKVLYEAPSHAGDADPAPSVEYNFRTLLPGSVLPTLTAWLQYYRDPRHRRAPG